MAFWTQKALGPLAQSESSGNPSLIHYPSGYTPSGVRSSASGLYGYLDSTWVTYANQAGVDTTLYPRAYMAPASVQNQVALITPISNWTCPGCNARASALAVDPSNVSSTPVGASGTAIASGPADTSSGVNAGSGTGTGTGSSATSSSSSTSSDQAQGTPIQVGLQPEEVSAIQKWVDSFQTATGKAFAGAVQAAWTSIGSLFKGVENWFIRGGLILIGIVLLLIGLAALMWDHGGGDAVKRYAPALAA